MSRHKYELIVKLNNGKTEVRKFHTPDQARRAEKKAKREKGVASVEVIIKPEK